MLNVYLEKKKKTWPSESQCQEGEACKSRMETLTFSLMRSRASEPDFSTEQFANNSGRKMAQRTEVKAFLLTFLFPGCHQGEARAMLEIGSKVRSASQSFHLIKQSPGYSP